MAGEGVWCTTSNRLTPSVSGNTVATAHVLGRDRGRRLAATFVVTAVVAVAVGFGVHALLRHVAPACTVGSGTSALVLAPDQAEDAATIAVVAKRLNLPDHAVTIAVATSLQESKLHNYPFGDRDSLGLFQQRPSQGWGRPAQLLTPSYAAEAFYEHLQHVDGWESLPVAAAAQSVQHSADGTAYAQWEETARAIARALTGEVPHGMTCNYPGRVRPRGADLRALAEQELGPGVLDRSDGSSAQDWTVAEWLVGHAYGYGVVSVTVRGERWTNDGHWHKDDGATGPPSYRLATRRS
jgi:hypothetical protein